MLTLDQGKCVVQLAQDTIRLFFTQELPSLEPYQDRKFHEHRAVYITIHKKDGDAITDGIPYEIYPLFQAIMRAARQVAFETAGALKKEELEDVWIDVHILTTPILLTVRKPVEYLQQIHVGFTGVMVQQGNHHALILPHVAEQEKWSSQQLLEQACRQAGLEKDAWRDKQVKVSVFEAQTFRERNGAVQELE